MSACVTFDLATGHPMPEIQAAVEGIWSDTSVEVMRCDGGRVEVTLSYYCSDARQHEEIYRVLEYLFSIAQEDWMYYFRDRGSWIPGADPDYPHPIYVEQIFSEIFRPGLFDGIQYRYVLKRAAS